MAWVSVTIRDVSATGAYFESDRGFDPNSSILVSHKWPMKRDDGRSLVSASGVTRRIEDLHNIFGIAVNFKECPHFVGGKRLESDSSTAKETPSLFSPPTARPEAFEESWHLNQVSQFIQTNGLRHITLVRCAQVACMERSYFSTYFRERVGITFTEWIRELRMQEARRLMARQNYTISQIASVVGYRSLRGFERAFMRSTDLRPREFKELVSP